MRFLSPAFLTLFLMLAGCANLPVADYGYTPPGNPGARICTDQCAHAKLYCQQGCDLGQRSCVKSVQTQALKDYDDYTRRQFASHAPIEFRPRDFERYTSCDTHKKACMDDCESPYASCYKQCGGDVDVKGSCTFSFLCF